MSDRRRTPDLETDILVRSGRRCCICFGLSNDLEEKKGQIAHLDRNPGNSKLDNLAFLCVKHHDEYDAQTSQSRRWSPAEAKAYRALLYKIIESLRSLKCQKTPTNAHLGVLHVGHNLRSWERGSQPRLDTDYHCLREVAAAMQIVLTERDLLDFSRQMLHRVGLLVLVCPKDSHYSRLEMDNIERFVRSGGRLLIMAYYWWRCDHDTNIGELTERFGVSLRDDRVCDPVDCEQSPYQPICRHGKEPLAHHGVVLPFACSMILTRPAEPLLMTGQHARSEIATRVNRQIVRSFDAHVQGCMVLGGWAQVGRGKVVVLGSWEIFLDELCSSEDCGNRKFQKGVLSWLRNKSGADF